jgi:hypothetical protein
VWGSQAGGSIAEKNSFRTHDNTIPGAIRSLAKNGISPALTLFLPASLERIRSSNVKTVKHGTGETTKITVIDLTDFPNEQELDQATWCTCYNTFLTFLEGTAGTRIFEGFATTTASLAIRNLPCGFLRTVISTAKFGRSSSQSRTSLNLTMSIVLPCRLQ